MDISPLSLAQSLLRCPSVTPEEGGALAFIEGVLQEAGFEVHRPVFSEPGTPDVENLYARYGAGGPCLLFAGHTDVVPPGDPGRWRHDPFGGRIENGELHGRGAVDMKGGIACMMAAALGAIRQRPGFKGAGGFLITGGGEGAAVKGAGNNPYLERGRGGGVGHYIPGGHT